ncbi:bacillithiol system redox-active protein YtxJ [Bacillus sp. 165]|uniref:bacillithiol system redox-active protein YtxJ n=1 Tax=Bacillus sp. 165 TaxID=1529117 RepID=UPI001ADA3078|nr:bacillithiol system redox-active protein YtxJ [Bacillus sp. 165]MBO9131226.1 bacillithiol system redox-active protein YtxJ [Bacillus sp. 165]
MSKMKLETQEQLLQALQENQNLLLFKHSLTCPISQGAWEEFNDYVDNGCTVPVLYVYVQEGRAVSNFVAEHFGIKHESPQVLYIQNGEVAWHTSHWNIKKQVLQEHVG